MNYEINHIVIGNMTFNLFIVSQVRQRDYVAHMAKNYFVHFLAVDAKQKRFCGNVNVVVPGVGVRYYNVHANNL